MTAHGHQLTILTAHLKSKVLTLPEERFQPRDEAERARFGADALYLPTGHVLPLQGEAEL